MHVLVVVGHYYLAYGSIQLLHGQFSYLASGGGCACVCGGGRGVLPGVFCFVVFVLYF